MANGKRGAPIGNKNGTKSKAWSDALRRALEGKQNANKLAKLADKLVELALEEGNMQAFREIGDRLEGKPAQMIEGSGKDGSIHLHITTDDKSVL